MGYVVSDEKVIVAPGKNTSMSNVEIVDQGMLDPTSRRHYYIVRVTLEHDGLKRYAYLAPKGRWTARADG